MAFGSGKRPWMRGPREKIAASTTVLGQGELLVDDRGAIYGGDGSTQLKDLKRLQRIGEHLVNVRQYGARGDGTTDDTAAIMSAIAAMTIYSVFGQVTTVLYFPAGRYLFSGSAVFNARTIVRGDGKYISLIYAPNAVNGDAFTFNAQNSGLEHVSIGGNGAAKRVGDGAVFNAAYPWLLSCRVENVAGNGYTIGKTAAAIGAKGLGVDTRDCDGYGVFVQHAGSTDGQYSMCDLGRSGLSGFRAGAAGTQLNQVHAWGCGVSDITGGNDGNGIWLSSSNCTAVNCEGETNLGAGLRIGTSGANACTVTGGLYWGNAKAGIQGVLANRGNVSGAVIFNNGVSNTAGATSAAFAAVQLDGCSNWDLNYSAWDDGAAIEAGFYPNGTPSFPFLGRTAGLFTQSYNYAEAGASDYNILHGLKARAADTRTGNAVFIVGINDVFAGNDFGTQNLPTVASAATITLPGWADVVEVTGTTAISSINTGRPGRRVTLIFTNAAPGSVSSGSHLVLRSAFTPAQNWTLTLISQGTTWYEVSRTV